MADFLILLTTDGIGSAEHSMRHVCATLPASDVWPCADEIARQDTAQRRADYEYRTAPFACWADAWNSRVHRVSRRLPSGEWIDVRRPPAPPTPVDLFAAFADSVSPSSAREQR